MYTCRQKAAHLALPSLFCKSPLLFSICTVAGPETKHKTLTGAGHNNFQAWVKGSSAKGKPRRSSAKGKPRPFAELPLTQACTRLPQACEADCCMWKFSSSATATSIKFNCSHANTRAELLPAKFSTESATHG